MLEEEKAMLKCKTVEYVGSKEYFIEIKWKHDQTQAIRKIKNVDYSLVYIFYWDLYKESLWIYGWGHCNYVCLMEIHIYVVETSFSPLESWDQIIVNSFIFYWSYTYDTLEHDQMREI